MELLTAVPKVLTAGVYRVQVSMTAGSFSLGAGSGLEDGTFLPNAEIPGASGTAINSQCSILYRVAAKEKVNENF